MTTFDIVEKGAIADSGELIGIRTNEIVRKKETSPVLPVFRNNGNRKVVAQFKGEIRNLGTDKIEKILESDKLEVGPGESIEFPLYFEAEKTGEYQISGRVVYNNKITFNEQSKVIKVTDDAGLKLSSLLYLILYFIIGFIIFIMIAKIRKERRKRHR